MSEKWDGGMMPYYFDQKDLEMNDDNMNKWATATNETPTVAIDSQPLINTTFTFDNIVSNKPVPGVLGTDSKPSYKYNEDLALKKITNYINGTYGQHYVGNGTIQTVDFWESLGSLETTCRDTAIKYLARYGKKSGKNEKDLLKAIHYIILMMYAKDCENDPERNGDNR